MNIAQLRFIAIAATVIGFPLFSSSAIAEEFKNPSQCAPGLQVLHRNGQQGVVLKVDDGFCKVRLPNGTTESWLFWMTRKSGSSALTSDKLTPGKYQCYSGSNYLFMDIHIRSGGIYADRTGKTGTFKLDPATNKITFASGPLKGAGSLLLAGPRIGLNFNQSNFYNTTCSLARN